MATIVVLATIVILGHYFLINEDNDLLTIAELCFLWEEFSFKGSKIYFENRD